MTEEHSENTGRLVAIGDIHGHALALHGLLDLITPEPNDVIVTLGDYVNRGPDSKGVIERLLRLQQECTLIPVLGNHDEMMLDSRADEHAEERWRSQGGTGTLKSYGNNNSTNDIPEAHWDFLSRCVPCHETESFLFTHANYCWYSSIGQQPAS